MQESPPTSSPQPIDLIRSPDRSTIDGFDEKTLVVRVQGTVPAERVGRLAVPFIMVDALSDCNNVLIRQAEMSGYVAA